jgi:hypothetical protein
MREVSHPTIGWQLLGLAKQLQGKVDVALLISYGRQPAAPDGRFRAHILITLGFGQALNPVVKGTAEFPL